MLFLGFFLHLVKPISFRLSKIDPMSSNIGFLMLECYETPWKRIVTFLQEKAIRLPKCDELICSWEKFKKIYEEDIQCPFEDICQINK